MVASGQTAPPVMDSNSAPLKVKVVAPQSDTSSVDTSRETSFVPMSLTVSPTAAITARTTITSKPTRPGWRMNITPANPTRMADRRRIPTRSPRNSAPAAVSISGTAWITAPMVEIGT